MEYIIKEKNKTEHYYYRGEGIKAAYEENMFFPEDVIKDVKEPFSVLKKDGILHIICVNRKNELVYIPKKDAEYKPYILCELNEGFCVKNIKIIEAGNRLNLLYSAEYEEEMLLVHCILGNHAKPSVIDKMQSEYFYAYDGKVYYTNKNGILGYQELDDGKPDRFVSIDENAAEPYLISCGAREYLVYKKEGYIYLNHERKIEDRQAENPIAAERNGSIILIWKSGAVLKYSDINDNLQEIPKRVISTGMPTLYSVQDGEKIYYDYAASGAGKSYFPNVSVHKASSCGKEDAGWEDIVASLVRLRDDVKQIEEKIHGLMK